MPVEMPYGFYNPLKFSENDLLTIIKLHISDIPISESCAFFGGLGLSINNKIVLYPQCCGTFEDIKDWKKLLNRKFKPFYLTECHPSPTFIKKRKSIEILCSDKFESFYPATENKIEVLYDDIIYALKDAITKIGVFSSQLDKLAVHFKCQSISNILVWREN